MSADVKVLNPHRDDCNGLRMVEEGFWDSAWWLTGECESRDAAGRKGARTTRWIVIECNTTDCDARAIVREGFILATVEARLAASRPSDQEVK